MSEEAETNVGFQTGQYDFDPTYGYSLKQLLNTEPPAEPSSFDTFWQKKYEQAQYVVPMPSIQDTNSEQSHWRIFDLSYTSTDDFQINGWLLIPKKGAIKRGFIVGHGYGGRNEPDFHLPFDDAVLMFPCFRGLSLSKKAPISADPFWHVLHNIDNLDKYIIGGCVDDLWLAVTSMLRLFPYLEGRLGYLGISFGGGIGALALAWEKRIARCHFNVPTFGHHPLRLKLKTLGSANSVQKVYQTDKENIMNVLQYYDAANAAKRINMPVHCACAKFDPVVAPPGQFAIYNAIEAEKQLCVLDAGHYEYPGKSIQESRLLKKLSDFFSPLAF